MAATDSTPVEDLTSVPEPGRRSVLLFWAPWQEDSAPGGVCDSVLRALGSSQSTTAAGPAAAAAAAADSSRSLRLGRVEAEACAAVTRHYNVTAVPTFLLLRADGTVFERIEGSQDVSEVARAVQRLLAAGAPEDPAATTTASGATTGTAAAEDPAQQLRKRLETLTRAHPVMLFMKGTPTAPRCGFSRQAVELLQQHDIAFGSFDILQDEAVRQGLKTFSDWPTYPQLYANGELIGGLDILREMAQDPSAPLAEQLGVVVPAAAGSVPTNAAGTPPQSLQDRLRALVRQERVMLFLKGLPSAPQCGFSRQMVELLEEQGLTAYGAFDILQDPEVRQGLKELSDWPTYPQLYVDGELIGGLDIVREMAEDGSLKETLGL